MPELRNPVLESRLDDLEVGIRVAREMGEPMDVDTEKGTRVYRCRRAIWELTRDVRFIGTNSQQQYERALSLIDKSIELFGNSVYGQDQRKRMVGYIQYGESSGLTVPLKYQHYMREEAAA